MTAAVRSPIEVKGRLDALLFIYPNNIYPLTGQRQPSIYSVTC